MIRYLITLFLALNSASLWAQQFSMSLGLFTGITSTFTHDEGINIDPRYKERYELKFAPIGVNFGMDYQAIGFVATPGIINVGQNYYVVNTSGGQDGIRRINLQYLNVPVAFKVHVINLSFFKMSALASFGVAYLLDGTETIRHNETKLYFPEEVYPILPPDYIVQYDGVSVPEVDNYDISVNTDFKPVQLFAGAGFRADWDVSNHWRVIFDFRVNYGIYEPRTDEYLTRLNANQTLYDIPGKRRDTFVQLSVGISRYLDFEKSDQERKKKLKGSSKKYKPIRYPYAKPRNKKPKG
jgi:hypothetical protein